MYDFLTIFVLKSYKIKLEVEKIEEEVVKVISGICSKLKIDAAIDKEFCPGNFIKSQILLTFISSIADALDVIIPNNCYIFCDKNQKQLTIEETTHKIIKYAKRKKAV